MFLIYDEAVCEDMSPLWIFSLVALLSPCLYPITVVLAHEMRQCFGGSDAIRQLAASLFVTAFIVVYGALIIYGGYTCTNMTHTGLYIWALVTFYISVVSVCCVLCAISMLANQKEGELNYFDMAAAEAAAAAAAAAPGFDPEAGTGSKKEEGDKPPGGGGGEGGADAKAGSAPKAEPAPEQKQQAKGRGGGGLFSSFFAGKKEEKKESEPLIPKAASKGAGGIDEID